MAKTKGERPQNKNLKQLQDRDPEEARAIRSAGGKARQEQRREQKRVAEMFKVICDLPIKDQRITNRLKRMGITDEDLTNRMVIADAIFKGCKEGNTYAITLALDLLGENGAVSKENNLLEALQDQTKEDIDTSEIPEIQHATKTSNAVVE